MGDRCYMELQCRAQDVARFKELGFTPTGLRFAVAQLSGDEMNYACYDQLNDLAHDGIPFYGWHGNGGDYGANLYASDGRACDWIEVCPHSHGETPVARVLEDGSVHPDDAKAVREYYDRLRRAKAILAGEAKVEPREPPDPPGFEGGFAENH